MADNPLNPRDDGKVGMPSVTSGMNKTYSPDMTPADKRGKDEDAKKAQEADQKILQLAIKRFKRCVEAESDNRKAALEDLKFKAGDQWPADIKTQRANKKRPCLTINTIPTLTHQVTNDLRQNRPAINVSPMGNRADKEAAEAYAGMINAIERDSQADIAYDTGITSAVDVGFGYWRILTEYESEDSFNQVLRIGRLRNPFRAYLDPGRQQPDGSDAKFGFISDLLPRAEYNAQYPGADELGWKEAGIGEEMKEWIQKDYVRIAEYFTVEHEMRRLVQLSSGHVGFYDDLADDVKHEIESGKTKILKERRAEVQKVMWYKITGLQILERREWPGRWIPIVEVLGEEIDIEGKVIKSGMIRNAKDPARMKNYWATMKTEMIALAPKAPWIGAEGQFEGHEEEWDNAHTEPLTRLEYNPVTLDGHLAPPPQRQPMVGIPEGIVQAEASSQQDLMATTGVRFDAMAADRIYDESGKKLKEIRRNIDIGSFHFMDNASRSMLHTGRILVDLIPKIYDTKRVITILREDDSEERVTLDPQAGQPFVKQPGAQESVARKIFNPTIGQYGVTVTIGPSYATKRIEAAEQMMEFARALPQKGDLIAHLIAKYSDWPGSDEAYKILTKALPPNLLAPDMRDLPPQVATFVQSLMQQISQMAAERMQMLKDLTDQKADRALQQEKIDRDFEAKITKILVDAKTKMLAISADDVRAGIQLADETAPQLPAGTSAGGVAPDAPAFPGNQPAMPASPVSQPNF